MREFAAAIAILGGGSLCGYGLYCIYPPVALIAVGVPLVLAGVGIVKLGNKATTK